MGKKVLFFGALLAACTGLLYVAVDDWQKDDVVALSYMDNSEPVGFVLPATPFVSTGGNLLSYHDDGREVYGSTVETEVSKLYSNGNLVLNTLPSGKNRTVERRVQRTVSSGATMPVRRLDEDYSGNLIAGSAQAPLVIKTRTDIPTDKLRAMSIISATSGMSASLPLFAPVLADGTTLPPPPRTTYENDQLGAPVAEGLGCLLLLVLAYTVFIRMKQRW